MRILIDPFDEAERLFQQRGNWIVGVVETRVFWPQKKQIIHFDGKDFMLMPLEPHEGLPTPTLPAIALKADAYQLSDADARKEILRFASALSWREGSKIEIVSWSSGNIARSIGILHNSGRTDYLDTEHLPSPENDAARTALAFFREGISLDNPFYAFLSLYKAFSVAIPDGCKRGPWMTEKRAALDDNRARERLAEIETGGNEVGNYLYDQCRHAIAHADREPFVNPDNTDDHQRLTKDLPLMRNFVELAIEESFDVRRHSTIYREHLYELEGFRERFPQAIVDSLKRGEGLQGTVELEFPGQLLLVAVRGHERYALPEMDITGGGWVQGGLILDSRSREGTVELQVALDFVAEKLHFDPMRGFKINKAREVPARVQDELAALRFLRCILSNGHLEIWDRVEESRLGCSESYIPLNCFVNTEFFNAEVAALEKLLATN